MDDIELYAGFFQRFFAAVMDVIILGFVTFIAAASFFPEWLLVNHDWQRMMTEPNPDIMLDPFIFHPMHFVLPALYYIGFYVSRWQATVGMRMMGIYITNMEGGRIGIIRGLLRHVAEFLSALLFMIGYLLILVTPKRQALHDMIASTTVRRGVL